MMKKLVKTMLNFATERSRIKKIAGLIQMGLPKEMEPALNYLVSGHTDPKTATVVKTAENRRREIASKGDEKIPFWYSPQPGSAGNDSSIDARPQPGKVLEFPLKRIAQIGKNQRWGTALYLIAKEFRVSVGVELGACVGISAIYLASAPNIKEFVTVEGSEPLAKIAQESLKICTHARVLHALFDDAIDAELPSLGSKVDLAYIDGHHEKIATIHYFNKLLPFLKSGAVVIFDDISWSHDMRDAWNILSKRPEFAHALDLGAVGVCVMKKEFDSPEMTPSYWELQPIIGKSYIGEPPGWKES